MDLALRKNSKITGNIQDLIKNAVLIYSYLVEKDVFELKYQRYLSMRLIQGTSRAEIDEHFAIRCFKLESSSSWIKMLESMFQDVHRSGELNQQFQKIYNAEQVDQISFDVKIGGLARWPSNQQYKPNLPQQMRKIADKFDQFYRDLYPTQKLTWCHTLGHVVVDIRFSTTKHAFQCTPVMAMILFTLDGKRSATLEEISQQCNIPISGLSNEILSLAHPTIKLLLKNPNVKTLNADDQFCINWKYTSKLRQVVLPLLNFQPADNKKQQEEDRVIELERSNRVDANIVRTMKIRKELHYHQLIAEVITILQSKFNPDPRLVKKRIEALIEQEYLERDESDRTLLRYLASCV